MRLTKQVFISRTDVRDNEVDRNFSVTIKRGIQYLFPKTSFRSQILDIQFHGETRFFFGSFRYIFFYEQHR